MIWHEVECGGYDADLSLWEELADEAVGPILELGCGTGRVALHLARREHLVRGLDLDANLVAAFNNCAGELPAMAKVADARDFELASKFGLVLAPMQLMQLFADERERVACLACMASHLRSGGKLALVIAENVIGGTSRPADGFIAETQVFPDVREADGWVYSSLPLETVVTDGEIVVRRLRQTVSPQGELSDAVDEVRLRVLDAGTLEREAETVGLNPLGRREIPATEAHVGSTVVLLERSA